MHPSLGRSGARRHLLRAGHDLVDEAVLPGLLRSEPAVPVGVLLDLLDGLAGVEGEPLLHGPLGVEHLLGLDGNVGGGAAQPTGRLMHHDPRVREGIALAGRAGAEQELPHRCGQAEPDRGDVVLDILHGVVDRHAGGHRTARRVDVKEDVAVAILSSTWLPRKTIRSLSNRLNTWSSRFIPLPAGVRSDGSASWAAEEKGSVTGSCLSSGVAEERNSAGSAPIVNRP